MNKAKLKFILTIILIFSTAGAIFGWGAWAHKHISRAAVFALPSGMITFYYNHIDFLTEGAVVPDLRRALLNDRTESSKHYIDIEDYSGVPIDSFPATLTEAYTKFDSASIYKNGWLPWYIQNLEDKLTEAFKKHNKSEIIFLSAEISHYLADAHMPLHTSANYDGQKTDQRGIHALWESKLPPLFGDAYNFNTPAAKFITDIPGETWKIIRQSHGLVNNLLQTEKNLRTNYDTAKLYQKDTQGNYILFYNRPVFSDDYATSFHQALNGMVEQQLRLSIEDIANFWYTAWVNAGRPNILSLDDPHLTRQNRKNFKTEYNAWTRGHVLNLEKNSE